MERIENFTLLTDFYQLTMMGGYLHSGRARQEVVFDLFFRSVPSGGGFCVAAGLAPAIDYVTSLRFGPEEIEYLAVQRVFPPELLEHLESFTFAGDIDAVPEGTLVFPYEPLLRVRAPIIQAQLIETALLNQINFQTLIATKAARISLAAAGAPVLEFGLRRAQGSDGGLSASRAAYIGGASSTSNVLAGQRFGIPVRGTMAHSWVMSFPSEIEAFRAYARCYPDACLLLVDTYDTLRSGVPNAIRVAKELEASGHRFAGIRLDSGDLAVLSREARRMLDAAGLPQALITASSDLDELLIQDLRNQGARIDVWGVGTSLATSRDCPALGGVYKVAAAEENGCLEPRIKRSDNIVKLTDPGMKDLFRIRGADGMWLGDVLTLHDEPLPEGKPLMTHHRTYAHLKRRFAPPWTAERLLEPVLRSGRRQRPDEGLTEMRQRAERQLALLAPQHKRFTNPEPYWLGLSDGLWDLKLRLLSTAPEDEAARAEIAVQPARGLDCRA
jgi:nicotinate phosphoribosyltransferase